MVRNFRPGYKWTPGIIINKLGPVRYLVNIGGSPKHIHVNHILPDTANIGLKGQSYELEEEISGNFDDIDILIPSDNLEPELPPVINNDPNIIVHPNVACNMGRPVRTLKPTKRLITEI